VKALVYLTYVLAALWVATPKVYADGAPPTSDLERARAHYEAGRALYGLGNFDDALREFTSGYQLSHKPLFLLNLGQAYRKLNKLEKARDTYEKFLREAAPDDGYRAEAQRLLADVRQQLLVQPVPPPPILVMPAVVTPTVVAVHKPNRRLWWILPATVVVGVGLGVGLYFGLRPQLDCGSVGLGCVARNGP